MTDHDLFQIVTKLSSIKLKLDQYCDFFVVALGICVLCLVSLLVTLSWISRMYFPRVSASDFMRLTAESESIVFQFRFPFKRFGYNYYCSLVKGNRIWTASKEPLELSASCLLIQRP